MQLIMADILTQLKNIGLSDNEAKVYLAMLELGPSPVLEIAAKAGVNRPTTYVQIESLKKMGLVSTQTKGKKQLFLAESPDQLEGVLERERKMTDEKVAELAKALPELKTLFGLAGERPQVRFFEGKEGVLRMSEQFLKTNVKEVLAISSPDDMDNVFLDFPKNFAPQRVKKGIHSRLIYTSNRGAFIKRHDQAALREARFISPEKMPVFNLDLAMYENKVSIIALRGKLSGVIIEHVGISESFRGLFEFLWSAIDKE